MSLHATCSMFKPYENQPCGKSAPYLAVDWEHYDSFRLCEQCKDKIHSFYELMSTKRDILYALRKLSDLRRNGGIRA